jgi:peptide-methionine (S)-S-oxide reductase
MKMKAIFTLILLTQFGLFMEAQNLNKSMVNDTATFGGGCFWCLEAVFDQISGVSQVVSGYAGGHVKNPSYREVCNGTTGHAEVVQVVFDPLDISYDQLLDVFFAIHDPTTLNKQGGDVGTQYRSVIFYHNNSQKISAEKYINQLIKDKTFSDPIVTEVKELTAFYRAEDYHQDYFENNPSQPYCSMVVSPKVEKFKKKYKGLLVK